MNVLLDRVTDPKAEGILRNYLQNYTGRHFASLVSPGPAITASDIVAVSCLSVNIPPEAAVSFIDNDDLAQRIQKLRRFDIFDHPDTWFDEANDLYGLLKTEKKMGPVKTSKVLHAKLPKLIPIWDDLTNKALRYDKGEYWRSWHRDLVAGREEILEAVSVLRANVPASEDLPLLRVLDIVIWGIEESNRKK